LHKEHSVSTRLHKVGPAGAVLAAVLSLVTASTGRADDAGKQGVVRPAKARTLFGVTWQPSRAEALKKATPASVKDKPYPVFLVQILGDLAGHT
jgi:hypothetical protein